MSLSAKNKDDEKTPFDERLDAESEESSDLHALFPEPEGEIETEEPVEPEALWHEARHLEIEKPESALDLELETPLELEEQEVVDDPVRMYPTKLAGCPFSLLRRKRI